MTAWSVTDGSLGVGLRLSEEHHGLRVRADGASKTFPRRLAWRHSSQMERHVALEGKVVADLGIKENTASMHREPNVRFWKRPVLKSTTLARPSPMTWRLLSTGRRWTPQSLSVMRASKPKWVQEGASQILRATVR